MMNTTRNSARALLTLGLLIWAAAAGAVSLDLPIGARVMTETERAGGSYLVPTAPWDGANVPGIPAEGLVSRQVWRIETAGLTNLQILRPLRAQLDDAGFDILFECSAAICGGFDFRFGIDVTPAPVMHVDLTNFQFLSAENQDETYVSILISRSLSASFVEITQVASNSGASLRIRDRARPSNLGPTGPLGASLESDGRVILSDLTFETGSSNLGKGPFASLSELADYLSANPGRRVALVGHTDAVGSLDGNIALSKRRAGSVVDRLVARHGVSRDQISAEGMGYLSPVAANLTETGREANRRVEAVLVSVE